MKVTASTGTNIVMFGNKIIQNENKIEIAARMLHDKYTNEEMGLIINRYNEMIEEKSREFLDGGLDI